MQIGKLYTDYQYFKEDIDNNPLPPVEPVHGLMCVDYVHIEEGTMPHIPDAGPDVYMIVGYATLYHPQSGQLIKTCVRQMFEVGTTSTKWQPGISHVSGYGTPEQKVYDNHNTHLFHGDMLRPTETFVS